MAGEAHEFLGTGWTDKGWWPVRCQLRKGIRPTAETYQSRFVRFSATPAEVSTNHKVDNCTVRVRSTRGGAAGAWQPLTPGPGKTPDRNNSSPKRWKTNFSNSSFPMSDALQLAVSQAQMKEAMNQSQVPVSPETHAVYWGTTANSKKEAEEEEGSALSGRSGSKSPGSFLKKS
ncbi:unnamed protein product, partial [Amoebophrya sp. A25]|eukprot:GSA25T00001664001.1